MTGIECVDNVFVVGFNHSVMNTSERSGVVLDAESLYNEMKSYPQKSLQSLTYIQTCNRFEIYGQGDLQVAEDLFYKAVKEIDPDHKERLIKKRGGEAIEHVFRTAAGLDSELVGDLEILGQFKDSFRKSKSEGALNGYMERLANNCIQAAKEIRQTTKITSGTTSHSYAAIQLLKEKGLTEEAKILLIGAGTFGVSIARNIKAYFPNNDLTVTNRTYSKSLDLARELSCQAFPLEELRQHINNYDVVISGVSRKGGHIYAADLCGRIHKTLIDLSVPSFFDDSVEALPFVSHYSVDHASEIINRSMEDRHSSVPVAQNILSRHIHEFTEWSKIYDNSNHIKEWKETVEDVSARCPHIQELPEEEKNSYLKKSVAEFAVFLKNQHEDHPQKERLIEHFLNKECEGNCVMYKAQEKFPSSSHCDVCKEK